VSLSFSGSRPFRRVVFRSCSSFAGAGLPVAVMLLAGCSEAPVAPPVRLGSLSAEPELTVAAVTASADPARLRVPQVIAAPKPFRLGDVATGTVEVAATMGRSLDPFAEASPVLLASAVAPAEPARLPAVEPPAAQTAEIRDMLTGYLRAFNQHDAAAAAEHWTVAAENVNLDSGEVTRGREAVRGVFAALFELDAEAAIDIDLDAIRPLREDVAVIDGVSRVSYTDGEVAGSRFSAVVVRDEGRWRLASVRETACPVPVRAARPLDELAWLVGHWENVGAGVTASGECGWSGDHHFLTRRHLITPAAPSADSPPAADGRIPELLPAAGTGRRELTEIIAWDPERETVRSWIFSSDGRFAEATWARDGAAWTVRVEGRGLDAGREATCTLSPDGPDGLLVQVEGESLAGLLPPACGFTRTAR
jgi:uncharacterized protein (TIGR02246 family)